MDFQQSFILLEGSPLMFGGDDTSAAETTAGVGQPGDAPAPAPAQAESGWFGPATILMYAAIFVGFYFLLIRPQKKREKTVRDMQSALKTGDAVVTTGGLFGTIVGIGEDCFMIEFGTNKGIRIPVRKTDIVGIKSPITTPSKEEGDK